VFISTSVRRARLEDAEIVTEITRKAYSKWVSLIGREPKPMVVDYREAIANHLIELYEESGVVHGLIELIPSEQHLLIENVAVVPTSQGKGIGHVLLEHASSVAEQLDLPELRLYTNAVFAGNIAYYSKHGYTECKREHIASGDEVVHMKRTVIRPSSSA